MAATQVPSLNTSRPLAFADEHASADDVQAVAALIDRLPKTAFTVVVRDRAGSPVVIRNAPLEADGTPMPTRYWLVGPREIELIGRLEAGGGVRRAQAELDPALVQRTHDQHRAARDASLPPGWTGHRPAGGVAGTRRGVKCLHAHYACWLAGEEDVVGQWVADQLHTELPSLARRVSTTHTPTNQPNVRSQTI